MFYTGEWYDVAMKAGLQGLITGLGSGALFGFSNGIRIGGGNTRNIVVYTSMMGAVASLVADVVHQVVHKDLPVSKKNKDLGAQVLGMVSSGIIYVSALGLYEPISLQQMGYATCFFTGCGAEYLALLSQSMLQELY